MNAFQDTAQPHVPSPAATGGRRAARAAALAVTLGIAGACWVLAIRDMSGMDMGAGTALGSFGPFTGAWVTMMAAMMLPGAAPAIMRRAGVSGEPRGVVPAFVLSYLAVWALLGAVVYLLYRPHGTAAAGAIVIAAGGYELTPLKRRCRRRCYASPRSGLVFGLYCAGSSLGFMVMLAALGIMSVTWMAVITVLVAAQKVLPPRAAIDVPLALAIITLGAVIVIAPSAVPGLIPPM